MRMVLAFGMGMAAANATAQEFVVAPKSEGEGSAKTVSSSEKDPGKPKGFILFAVEW